MSEHYYTVGVHGPPTKETAPHGFRYQPRGVGEWYLSGPVAKSGLAEPTTRWYSVPAPPTEEAPKPEPVARWMAELADSTPYIAAMDDAHAFFDAADALNALYRDGVAWGEPRPMSELPDGHTERVLIAYEGGDLRVWQRSHRLNDDSCLRVGWWPLPEVTP